MTHEGLFSVAEREILSRHFSNVDEPVFALTDLPDVVKGALFARYSRSPKSLRRLYLDEFYNAGLAAPLTEAEQAGSAQTGVARAEELYERMLVEYGDDSVAQLVGVHVAVEDASNILTKILEWGRLLSYLEQSTRYIPYNQKQDDGWRYHTPKELDESPLRDRYLAVMDACFETYAAWFERVEAHLRQRFPKAQTDTKTAYRLALGRKPVTFCVGCCLRPQPPMSASSVRRRGSNRCCSIYRIIRLPRRGLPGSASCASCARSFRYSCGASIARTADAHGRAT